MELRVEELAAQSGVRVDTVRFYQSKGLLPAPERVGRIEVYDDTHLERLRRIKELQQQGFTLAQIERVLERSAGDAPELLAALIEKKVGGRTWSRSELAAEAGVPEVLIRAAESAGLLEPMLVDGEERFGDSDVEMARAGKAILDLGFPLHVILEESIAHARHIDATCDTAIELFDAHIRKSGPTASDDRAITEVFQQLLPQVTRLVALHFQRTLVGRALRRLESKHESDAFRAAVAATAAQTLEVDVTWR
jgi:DNA-binding transcriptional MerR regulator